MGDMVNPTLGNEPAPTTYGEFIPTQEEADELDLGRIDLTVFMLETHDTPMFSDEDLGTFPSYEERRPPSTSGRRAWVATTRYDHERDAEGRSNIPLVDLQYWRRMGWNDAAIRNLYSLQHVRRDEHGRIVSTTDTRSQ